jgi:hypothetical protein
MPIVVVVTALLLLFLSFFDDRPLPPGMLFGCRFPQYCPGGQAPGGY